MRRGPRRRSNQPRDARIEEYFKPSMLEDPWAELSRELENVSQRGQRAAPAHVAVAKQTAVPTVDRKEDAAVGLPATDAADGACIS